MQRPEGHRCPGSGFGRPHGKHQRDERRKRAEERAAEKIDEDKKERKES